MIPSEISKLVISFIEKEFSLLGTKNKIRVSSHEGKWWISDPNHVKNLLKILYYQWNFVAGAKAIELVYKVKPDLTREGGSIPVTLTFQEALKKNVLLLPMGACDGK